MRLAVVSPFVDRRHGTERALTELLERLARDYHCEIHLYAERVEDLAVADSKTPCAGGSGSIVWHKVPSISGPHLVKFIVWMAANGFLRWWQRVFRGLSLDLVLSPGINCFDADVIIVHVVFQRLRELSRQRRAGEEQKPGFLRRLHRRTYYALLTALERWLYSDQKVALAAVSQRTADLLTQLFSRSDVRLIPNGVDSREFSESRRVARRDQTRRRLRFRDSDLVLLLIGNDWRVKGVPTILEAMALLPQLPLHLLVVGNDAAGPFRAIARHLGILDRCHWEPPRGEVIEWYAAADIYASPSQEDAFGLPTAEAMACGLPAITSVNAGISRLIHNSVDGFVLRESDDAQMLARIVERLYRDAAYRRSIGEAAARTAQQWTWERSAAEAWELLQALARMKGREALRRENAG